jgi:hypothetical protein
MAFVVEPFTHERTAAVKDLNRRLTAGSAPTGFRFPEDPTPKWLPAANGRRIYQEYYVLMEGPVARGAYALKHQDFSFRGQIRSVALWHLPLSEGIVNPAYAPVAFLMLRHALHEHELLYGLGFGRNRSGTLPKILLAMGWGMSLVPFYFRVNRPARFLKELRALRGSRARRALMDVASRTGVGSLGIRAVHAARTRTAERDVKAESVGCFESWADEVWKACSSRYGMAAVRDCESLKLLYPGTDPRFLAFKISRGASVIGWAVVLDSQMHDDEYFGDLRVGWIVDGLAPPEDVPAVVRAAADTLLDRGVDLIVSNQSHQAWEAGLRRAGFLPGPSNFLFAASKQLTSLLHPFDERVREAHLTRGDGGGARHL